MKDPEILLKQFILILLLSSSVFARGGGGCFLSDTLISTDHGLKLIDKITIGDTIVSFENGKLLYDHVAAVYRTNASEYYEITAAGSSVNVTAEHLFYTAFGDLKQADKLKADDELLVYAGERLIPITIESVDIHRDPATVYNILSDGKNNYLANTFLVHNKGCFLPDTPILTSDGEWKNIVDIKVGDIVAAYTYSGEIVNASVEEIHTLETEGYYELETNGGYVLKVTSEHPFYVGNDIFKIVEYLNTGDRIYIYDGKGLLAESIRSKRWIPGNTLVYNLHTDWPNTYFANRVAVHNKGGGGGGGGGGIVGLIIYLIFYIPYRIISFLLGWDKKDGDLDYCYPRDQIDEKAEKTGKVLEYLKGIDVSWDREELLKNAEATFYKLQDCWWKRSYSPMKTRLMPDLYKQHVTQIESLIRNHEIDVLDGISVDSADIVNVRYYNKKDMQEYTVLFEATVKDYYVDDRTNKFLRGDEEPTTFQEFYVFQRQDDKWLLRAIDQTRDSDALNEDNFVESLTPYQLESLYGELASKGKGEKASWLERKVSAKSGRVDKLLNFLSRTDKNWSKHEMKETVRRTFIEVLSAFEKRDTSTIKELVSDKVYDDYSETMREMLDSGVEVEYRNMCVRKVDIVLVKNYADNDKDEFTARISAHAQKIRRKGSSTTQDGYVTPFEEYWTFRKVRGEWRLSDVKPPAKNALEEENIDEESSKEQLQWYYTQDRAV